MEERLHGVLVTVSSILGILAAPAALIVIYGAVVLFVLWVRSRAVRRARTDL